MASSPGQRSFNQGSLISGFVLVVKISDQLIMFINMGVFLSRSGLIPVTNPRNGHLSINKLVDEYGVHISESVPEAIVRVLGLG